MYYAIISDASLALERFAARNILSLDRLQQTLRVYAHADTEAKRVAIERAMEENIISIDGGKRYIVDDESVIRHLYGI